MYYKFYTGAWAGIEPKTPEWEVSDNTTEPTLPLKKYM